MKKSLSFILAVILIISVSLCLWSCQSEEEKTYREASEMRDSEEKLDILFSLGDYKDSKSKLLESYKNMLKNGREVDGEKYGIKNYEEAYVYNNIQSWLSSAEFHVEQNLKSQLQNPSSYKKVSIESGITSWGDYDGKYKDLGATVIITYRATNGFGGVVTDQYFDTYDFPLDILNLDPDSIFELYFFGNIDSLVSKITY